MAKEQQNAPVQLCVYDTERDYPEGEEAQQILAYHPEACSISDQTAVVGLAQALLTFSANFEEEATCDSMHAQRYVWAFHRPQPDIMLLAVVDQGWLPATTSDAALQAVLRQAYAQFTLIHGPLRDSLANNVGQTKASLQDVLVQTAARLLRAKSADLLTLASPLSMIGGVPWLPLRNHVFTAVHSLASQLTVNDVGDGQMVQGVVMLHDQYCLWSSLSQQDTVSLYRLSATALLPAAQGPSIGKRLTSATSSLRSQQGEARHPTMSYKAWMRSPDGFLSLRPPAGSADTDQLIVPTLHLQDDEEQPGLLGYCQGSTVMVLLLSQRGMVSSTTQHAIASIAQAAVRRISQATAEQLTAQRHGHLPGFRYLFVDHMLTAVQASPQNKVATLSSESLQLMASAKAEMQGLMNSSQGTEPEVVVRGMHDCWVVARHRNGRDLYLVMEAKGEIGLAGAAELAADFSDKHFAALF